jgi:serine/threonine protein kinase
VCWIGACLADALHHAHERNLVHLDIKPSNVLMAANGQPMLLDFHLAGEPFGRGRQRPYVFGGTPGYMSPEHRDALQAIRESRLVERPVDARSDVYSLGVALYEALTGELPAKGDDLKSVRPHNASVTASLDDCITACLADDPARRHQDASALSALLRQHARDCVLGTH